MQKLLITLGLGLLLAGSALGVVDPDPNSLGFYFDLDADVYCIDAYGFVQAYVILTNPSFDEIKYVEFGLDWDESSCPCYGVIAPTNCISCVAFPHNVTVPLNGPLPTQQATVLATYYLGPQGAAVSFTMRSHEDPSIPGDYPVVVDGDNNIFQVGMSAEVGQPCAWMNGAGDCYVIDNETVTWGAVKSLYR